MMMTLEEKIEVIKAYAEDKPVEVYVKSINQWINKSENRWDFEEGIYRIKPNETTKFKVGDKVVLKEAEGVANPAMVTLTKLQDGEAEMDGFWRQPISELNAKYISVNNVLWYFEIYDYVTKTWKLIPDRRFPIEEADNKFASNHDTVGWRPMYALGFALKEE